MASGSFEEAASIAYEDRELRRILPALWQVKLNLEKRDGIHLGMWRKTSDAISELKEKYGRAEL